MLWLLFAKAERIARSAYDHGALDAVPELIDEAVGRLEAFIDREESWARTIDREEGERERFYR